MRHRRAALIWGTAAAFYVVAMFHRMSLAVASLDATERLGLSVDALALLAGLQLALYLALIIPAGLLVDRVGARLTLTAGLLAMATGQALFALATHPAPALAGRGLVGAGDALIFLCVLRLAQAWFPASRYATLALLTGAAGALGQLATTVPLGSALDTLGWTPVFLGSAVLTLAAAAACLAVIRDRPADAPAGPPPASLRTTPALVRAAAARAGTRRAFWTHLTLMGPFVAVTALWGYPWMVQDRGLSEPAARLALLACVALCAVAAPAAGLLVARRPALRDPIALTTAASCASLWAVALAWPGGAPATVAVSALVATGATCAAAMLAFDIARADNPPERAGLATGLANTGGFSAAVGLTLLIGALAGPLGLSLGHALMSVPVLMAGGITMMLRERPAAPAGGSGARQAQHRRAARGQDPEVLSAEGHRVG